MKEHTLVAVVFSVAMICLCPDYASAAAEKSKRSPAVSAEDTIAQVDEERIDTDYLTSYLSTRPLPAYSQVTAKIIEQRLEELITSEVLYRQALRIGLDKRPEIHHRIQQILAQNLLEEKVNKPVRERKITNRELQAYYNDHVNEFQRPAQVRLADIFIAVDPAAASGQRKQKKEKAEKALAEVLANQDQRLGFGKRILKYSDTPEKYPKGNTGFFDIQGKSIGLDINLAREAFKLEKAGQVCDHIIKTADGYHIIMLTGRREAVHKPFEKVKVQLRRRIYRERIALAQNEYIESMKKKCRIKINQDVFDKLVREQQVRAKALEVKTKGGFPAFPEDANVPLRKPRGPR
ncbi:MAG: peptidyl-prolyl cis-trans isomerase [Planctomycetota bacterium]|jgi:peptidyl-prolyl cis-trans isomerase C